MEFKDNLRTLRKERRMTQEDLAHQLDVSRQAVSKWEAGDGYPETEKLIRLADVLNVSIDELVNHQPDTVKIEDVKNPAGKIAISTFDDSSVVIAQAVKAEEIVFNGKGPKYILNGIDGVSILGEHTTILGWYLTKEDIEKEVRAIHEAISAGVSSYELKYFANVELKGLFGQPHIVEKE